MSKVIIGDAVKAVIDGDIDFLLHVTNNVGIMGSGIAAQIKREVPDAFKEYSMFHELGDVTYGETENGKGVVINLTSQTLSNPVNGRFLNYGAFAKCLMDAVELIHNFCETDQVELETVKVGLPVRLGACRAGGDWDIVVEMVEFIVGSHFHLVYYDFDKG
jgi:hypothetical protein